MASIALKDVRKSFGAVDVIHGVDLDIEQGEFIVFVGPSGCGKSTLLRLIAGLEDISAGTLEIDGKVVNDAPPSERGIAMVFQSYALYPHMTVYENMAFGLKLQGEKERVRDKVHAVAKILQIDGFLDRLPKQLSGGQRQRVAIGRAIVRDPKVFLFDEPLSNLDAALRVQTRIEINKLHEEMSQTTMIYVTHDQVEAMTLADRIVVLNGGQVEQVGAPMALYENPANLFVARFLGSPAMNVVPCTITESAGVVSASPADGHDFTLSGLTSAKGATRGTFGIRPEDLTVDASRPTLFEGEIDLVEKLGEVQLVYVNCGAGGTSIVAKLPANAKVERHQTIALTADPGAARLFNEAGETLHTG